MKKMICFALIICCLLSVTGCSAFETAESLSGKGKKNAYTLDELESGNVYVFKNQTNSKGKEAVTKSKDKSDFIPCPKGNISFKGEELTDAAIYPRAIWFEGKKDEVIPTLTSKDSLIYISDTEVPESITFERFYDNGYTIGVANMQANKSNHYYITFADMDSDDFIHYIDMESDASELSTLGGITKLYLDKVGDISVNEESVTKGGCVSGLKKNESYKCEFYTGTFYQDFLLKANVHTFTSFETFVSYDFDFLHANCIEIKIPDYFVSGYYFVNGIGLFRYVTDEDAAKYNGKAYDKGIKWNEPLIIYDENGFVVFNPSDEEGDVGETSKDIELTEPKEESEEKTEEADETVDDTGGEIDE